MHTAVHQPDTGSAVPLPIKPERARKKAAKAKRPVSNVRFLEREETASLVADLAKAVPAAAAVAPMVMGGPTKEDWIEISRHAGRIRDLHDGVRDLDDLLSEVAAELSAHGSIQWAVKRIEVVSTAIFNSHLLATAAYEKVEDILDRRWAAITEPEPDPVIELYERALAAEAAFNRFPEKTDPLRNSELEEDMDNAAYRLIAARPTTTAGVVAKLKYPAKELEHDDAEKSRQLDVAIVQNLIRHLSGDPSWTAAGEAL